MVKKSDFRKLQWIYSQNSTQISFFFRKSAFVKNTHKVYTNRQKWSNWLINWYKGALYGWANSYGSFFWYLFCFAILWAFVLLMHDIYIQKNSVHYTRGWNVDHNLLWCRPFADYLSDMWHHYIINTENHISSILPL